MNFDPVKAKCVAKIFKIIHFSPYLLITFKFMFSYKKNTQKWLKNKEIKSFYLLLSFIYIISNILKPTDIEFLCNH